jgi:hypothetical protein
MDPFESCIDIDIVVLVKDVERGPQCSRQDRWILRDDGDATPQVGQPNFGNICPCQYRDARRNLPIPSMMILPSCASTNRKKLRARVLLPHPVAPTIPIFCLGATENEMP